MAGGLHDLVRHVAARVAEQDHLQRRNIEFEINWSQLLTKMRSESPTEGIFNRRVRNEIECCQYIYNDMVNETYTISTRIYNNIMVLILDGNSE